MENISKIFRTKETQIYRNQSAKTSWQTEIGTHVNVIPRNTNLSCYNTVDKAISKNIEPGIINYVSLYQIQVVIPKHQKNI